MDTYTTRPGVLRNTDGTPRRTGKSAVPAEGIYQAVYTAARPLGGVAARTHLAAHAAAHDWVGVRKALVGLGRVDAEPVLRAAYYGD